MTRSRTKTQSAEDPESLPPKRKDPLWAKLAIILGALVMVVSGGAVVLPRIAVSWFTSNITQVEAIPEELRGANIDGAINVLLLGLDQREGEEAEDRIRADTIMVLHIPATHDRAYLISLPRDAEVPIPAYSKTKFPGYRDKINAAFAAGAVGSDGHRDGSPKGRAQGAELTALTISGLVPGGLIFNGIVIINFDGFLSVLEAIGGVHLCVDEEAWSIHYKQGGVRSYVDLTEQQAKTIGAHYTMGCRDMAPWEALDYARQRYYLGNNDGDYGRQRHQQQLIKAILAKVASGDTLKNFKTLGKLQQAAGQLLTLSLSPKQLEDWVLTLQSLRPDDLVMIKTNGGKFAPNGNGSNEQVTTDSLVLLKSVQTDTVFDFLTNHPDWIATDS